MSIPRRLRRLPPVFSRFLFIGLLTALAACGQLASKAGQTPSEEELPIAKTEPLPEPEPIAQAPHSDEAEIASINQQFECPSRPTPQNKSLRSIAGADLAHYRSVILRPIKLTYRAQRQANTLSLPDFQALQRDAAAVISDEWRLRLAWQQTTELGPDTLSAQLWLSDLTSSTAATAEYPLRITAVFSDSLSGEPLLVQCTDALYISPGLDGASSRKLKGSPFWQKLMLDLRRWASSLGSHITAEAW